MISVTAAVVSAIATAFAALAAWRSAASARDAQLAAKRTEQRAALREFVVSAHEVHLESRRAESRGADLKQAYRTWAVFCGASHNSGLDSSLRDIDRQLAEVQAASEETKKLSPSIETLYGAALDDITKSQAKADWALLQIRAIREDFESKLTSVEAECASHREAARRRGPQ